MILHIAAPDELFVPDAQYSDSVFHKAYDAVSRKEYIVARNHPLVTHCGLAIDTLDGLHEWYIKTQSYMVSKPNGVCGKCEFRMLNEVFM